MIHTYVINMAKDTAKRAEIERQLRDNPALDYVIWPATEGRRLSEQEIAEVADMNAFTLRYGRMATLPALGCSISHCRIYDDMISKGIDRALILEDDAILAPKFQNIVANVDRYLATCDRPTAILLTPDFRYHIKSETNTIEGNYCVITVTHGFMTSGYLLNLEAARLIRQIQKPVSLIADEWGYFISKGLCLKGVLPHIVSYPDGVGEIGASQRPASEPLLLRLRHVFGRFKARIHSLRQYAKGYRRSHKRW